MSPSSQRFLAIDKIWQFFFFSFLASFFLLMGATTAEAFRLRLIWGFLILFSFLVLYYRKFSPKDFISITLLIFALFVLFDAVRFVWGWKELSNDLVLGAERELNVRYVNALTRRIFSFAFFLLAFLFTRNQKSALSLLWVLALSSFFIAMNIMPAHFKYESGRYLLADGSLTALHPSFYFSDWVERYLIAKRGVHNVDGDVIMLGVFPALGLLSYALLAVFQSRQKRRSSERISPFLLGIPMLIVGAGSIVVLQFNSRGTILAAASAFFVFFLLILLKNRSLKTFILMLGILFCAFLFLLGSGKLTSVWTELQTLEVDMTTLEMERKGLIAASHERTSISTNVESSLRAMRMYKDQPIFGVGLKGYRALSPLYATKDAWVNKRLGFSKHYAMSHYMQVLAEEGIGAFIYFAFLLAYMIEFLWGSFKCKSRFQVCAGVAFFCAVLMLLVHGAISHVMDHFAVSLLAYTIMGASLGCVHSDFSVE